jgi:hypothetical protein
MCYGRLHAKLSCATVSITLNVEHSRSSVVAKRLSIINQVILRVFALAGYTTM